MAASSGETNLPPPPLFDLFMDLPHPRASPECPGAFIIPAPPGNAATTTMMVDPMIHQITPQQVAQFAFPEIASGSPPPPPPANTTPRLNQYDLYALQTTSSHFTFSWQLADGRRLHGHVRRYLPNHLLARTRYDVGRRGERALVLLTRHSTCADTLFTAILKSIEAISSQQVATVRSTTSIPPIHNGNPQQWFLYQLVAFQQTQAAAAQQQPSSNNKPIICTIANLELDNELYAKCDTHRFILPASLLIRQKTNSKDAALHHHQQHHNAAIMPLLRCVGISHTLRICTALLSERRVIFCSASPTRLTCCSHAALSMLNAGGLQWQHVFIPVLCPHICNMLAAPYPYLIGILQSNVLNTVDGVGEILMVHLDSNTLETRGISESQVMARLPDIVVPTTTTTTSLGSSMQQQQQQQQDYNDGATALSYSPCEVFIQDLSEVLKQDKRLLYGDSTLERVGETAAKAKEVVRKTLNKLRDRFQQQKSDGSSIPSAEDNNNNNNSNNNNDNESSSMTVDSIATETCHNETAEQEVRIAFCTFFLTFYGDVKWYLTKNSSTGTVALDRNRFLQQKQREYPMTSPMWQLAQNFCQTQLLEEFAMARIADIASQQQQQQTTSTSLLFFQCELYLRQKHMDFGVSTVQRIARHIADNSPVRLTGMPKTEARPTAMNLTSNKAFDSPDTNRMMARLVEECRECSSVLTDVMSVIWLRLRDCKGMQWKHGFLALQLLRNLLYHGPLTAITEATDGLSKIRSLKFYENIRAQCAQQVQSAATSVYCLLVDRAKLFAIRRKCADRRRKMHDPSANVQRRRQQNASLELPFRQIHALMHPSATNGTVVQIPPKSQVMSRGGGVENNGAPHQQTNGQQDFGGSDDVLGLFGDMSIGTVPALASSSSQDFEAFVSPPPSHINAGGHMAPQQQAFHQQQYVPPQQMAPQQMAPQQMAPQQMAPQQMPPQQMPPQQMPPQQMPPQHQQMPPQHQQMAPQHPHQQLHQKTYPHPPQSQIQSPPPQAAPPQSAVFGQQQQQVFTAPPGGLQLHASQQQKPPNSQTNYALGFTPPPQQANLALGFATQQANPSLGFASPPPPANPSLGFASLPPGQSGAFAPGQHAPGPFPPPQQQQPGYPPSTFQHPQPTPPGYLAQPGGPGPQQHQQQTANRMAFDPFARR